MIGETHDGTFSDEILVPVRIAYAEEALKQVAKNAGGRWNPEAKAWFVKYGRVKGTALEKHIIVDKKSK